MHTNDVLFTLQLLGDYIRADRKPGPNHQLIAKLNKLIGNAAIFMLYTKETADRYQTLLERYHDRFSLKKSRLLYQEECQVALPQQCRLHSVIHGLHHWKNLNTSAFSSQAEEQIQHLREMDKSLRRLLINKGLTLESADEILMFAGRELIDPELRCHQDLPLGHHLSNETSATSNFDCFQR